VKKLKNLTPLNILDLVKKFMMEYLYTNTCFFLRTLLIMPVTLGERSYSKLKVMKA